jgi:hypothetical protein
MGLKIVSFDNSLKAKDLILTLFFLFKIGLGLLRASLNTKNKEGWSDKLITLFGFPTNAGSPSV